MSVRAQVGAGCVGDVVCKQLDAQCVLFDAPVAYDAARIVAVGGSVLIAEVSTCFLQHAKLHKGKQAAPRVYSYCLCFSVREI